jgi:hypothetical protein
MICWFLVMIEYLLNESLGILNHLSVAGKGDLEMNKRKDSLLVGLNIQKKDSLSRKTDHKIWGCPLHTFECQLGTRLGKLS